VKSARLKISLLLSAIILLYLNFLIFFSSFSSQFWLNAGLVASVILLFIVARYGKGFLSPSMKRLAFFWLGVFIIVSLIYDFSYFYKRAVVRDWEDNIKYSLQKEAADIQEGFINLQTGIEQRAAEVETAILQLATDKPGYDTGLKGKIVSIMNNSCNQYLQNEFFYGASLYNADNDLVTWWGTASTSILPSIQPTEVQNSIFFNSVDEVRSYINNIRLIRNSTGQIKYYLIVRRLLRTDFRIHNRFLLGS
jgi:energy-coupling factor transporter transmembrane protein EcfT